MHREAQVSIATQPLVAVIINDKKETLVNAVCVALHGTQA
jgi:hypothetical protein